MIEATWPLSHGPFRGSEQILGGKGRAFIEADPDVSTLVIWVCSAPQTAKPLLLRDLSSYRTAGKALAQEIGTHLKREIRRKSRRKAGAMGQCAAQGGITLGLPLSPALGRREPISHLGKKNVATKSL